MALEHTVEVTLNVGLVLQGDNGVSQEELAAAIKSAEVQEAIASAIYVNCKGVQEIEDAAGYREIYIHSFTYCDFGNVIERAST